MMLVIFFTIPISARCTYTILLILIIGMYYVPLNTPRNTNVVITQNDVILTQLRQIDVVLT